MSVSWFWEAARVRIFWRAGMSSFSVARRSRGSRRSWLGLVLSLVMLEREGGILDFFVSFCWCDAMRQDENNYIFCVWRHGWVRF